MGRAWSRGLRWVTVSVSRSRVRYIGMYIAMEADDGQTDGMFVGECGCGPQPIT